LVDALIEAEEWMNQFGLGFSENIFSVAERVDGAGKSMKVFTSEAKAAADSTNIFSGALKGLQDELRASIDPSFRLLRASQSIKDAQDNLTEAEKKYKKNSPQVREAMRQLAEKAVDLEGAVQNAAGKLSGKMPDSLRKTLEAAKLTKPQIAAIEAQLRSAERAANNWEGTYTQTFITRYKEMGLKSPSGGMGGFQGHAAGGIVGAAVGGIHSGMRMVGEYGPELMELPPGTRVHSNPDSERMMSGVGQGGGLQIAIKPGFAGDSDIMDAILKALRFEIRQADGNVQNVLGVSGR